MPCELAATAVIAATSGEDTPAYTNDVSAPRRVALPGGAACGMLCGGEGEGAGEASRAAGVPWPLIA